MKLDDCFLQLVEFVHRTGFYIIGNVDVGFHSLVVAMSRPFHHYLCRNTESQRMKVLLPAWVPSNAYLGVMVSIRLLPL